jgi:2-polyprenyl-3-methyl-5-hydroxy-6-metoxy-1,4-benzoquinol methylase
MNNKLQSIVLDWIPSNSKVIDFGCGDGALLKILT